MEQNILVEENGGELKLYSEKELDEIYNICLEFDGIFPYRVIGRVEPQVVANEVIAGGQFEKVLIDLVASNYLLGVAEYKRNPSYNNEHFHHKAEVGFLNYLEEYDPELWGRIQNRLNEIENDSQREP